MTDTKKMPELLPCPFCGAEVRLAGGLADGFWIECQCRNLMTSGKDEVIEAWNRRSILLETPRMPEKLVPIFEEIERAVKKFPTWPTDPLHALAVLGEEFGELTKSALQLTYEPHKTSTEEFRTEAKQTAAMALRFFISLEQYQFKNCEQHKQSVLEVAPQRCEEG